MFSAAAAHRDVRKGKVTRIPVQEAEVMMSAGGGGRACLPVTVSDSAAGSRRLLESQCGSAPLTCPGFTSHSLHPGCRLAKHTGFPQSVPAHQPGWTSLRLEALWGPGNALLLPMASAASHGSGSCP